MLIYKKFKVFTLFAMILIFLTAISDTIIADNKVASNDLGSFYINAQNVLYFKGTLNGQTYTDYVPLTGANNATGIDASFIDGATQIYASGDTFSVIDSKGTLFGYGANLEQLYGTSGTNSAYSYLGGSNSNKIVNVSLTTQGSAIRAEDGSVSVRKANLDSNNTYSGPAQIVASYTSPLVTAEGTFNSHFDVKVFKDGLSLVPVNTLDVNQTDIIKNNSPGVIVNKSRWNDTSSLWMASTLSHAELKDGATLVSYDGFTHNGQDYTVVHVKDPQGDIGESRNLSSIAYIRTAGPDDSHSFEQLGSRSVSKVSVNDDSITLIYEDGEVWESSFDDPLSLDRKFSTLGEVETLAHWNKDNSGQAIMKDSDGMVYLSNNIGAHDQIIKVAPDNTMTIIELELGSNPNGIARAPNGDFLVLTSTGLKVLDENTGALSDDHGFTDNNNVLNDNFSTSSKLAFDDSGTLYINSSNQIFKASYDSNTDVVDINSSLTMGSTSAWGAIRIDPQDGHLWVADGHGSHLKKIHKDTGELLESIHTKQMPHPFLPGQQLEYIKSFNIDKDGKIHFTTRNRNMYGVLDPDTMIITDMTMPQGDSNEEDGHFNGVIDHDGDGIANFPQDTTHGAASSGGRLHDTADLLVNDDGTVLLVAPRTGKLRKLTPQSVKEKNLPEGLSLANITETVLDTNGDIMLFNNNDIYTVSSQTSALSLVAAVNPLYDDNGFDITGLHRDTGTQFDLAGLTKDGDAYASDGFDQSGYDANGVDVNGFDVQGFDANGFNSQGFDRSGYDVDGVSADGLSARNGKLAQDFELLHSVARESYFKTIVKTAQINSDALKETNLGELRVRNNTRDGYELTLSSATGGVLQPSGSSSGRLDGETDIPYTISLTKAGEIGTGIDTFLSFSSNALANAVTGVDAVPILKKAGVDGSATVSSATDAVFQLNIKMESNTDALGMAGTYADVLTLTYSDL